MENISMKDMQNTGMGGYPSETEAWPSKAEMLSYAPNHLEEVREHLDNLCCEIYGNESSSKLYGEAITKEPLAVALDSLEDRLVEGKHHCLHLIDKIRSAIL